MAQSLARQIKRGHVRTLWNSTFHRMELYKRVNSGLYIACNVAGKLIGYGPGLSARELDKAAEK